MTLEQKVYRPDCICLKEDFKDAGMKDGAFIKKTKKKGKVIYSTKECRAPRIVLKNDNFGT